MAATPETHSNLAYPEKSPVEYIKKTLRPSILNRDNLNYTATVGTAALLNAVSANSLYDLNYAIFNRFTDSPNLAILDQFRDLNTAVSIVGGAVLGDIIYTAWKKTRPS